MSPVRGTRVGFTSRLLYIAVVTLALIVFEYQKQFIVNTIFYRTSISPNTSSALSILALLNIMASNEDIIKQRQANLDLPDQPPNAPSSGSADGTTTNVGYGGGRSDDFSAGGEAADGLRGPATGASAVRDDGTLLKENTASMNVGRVPGGTASDATAGSKLTGNEQETRNPEKKGDPSNPNADTRAPKETVLSSESEGPGA